MLLLFRTAAFLLAIVVAGGALAHAQSLAEAAAKEKERRAKLHSSGESFSDSDLQEAGAKRAREGSSPSRDGASPSPAASGPATGKPPAAKDGGGAGRATKTEDASDTASVESAKKARGLELKTRLAGVNVELSAAEGRLKEAERQWNAVYMHSVGYPLEQAAAALESARKDVSRLTKERDDIEDTARREGIPPGYMR
jgi:hypothetical protein